MRHWKVAISAVTGAALVLALSACGGGGGGGTSTVPGSTPPPPGSPPTTPPPSTSMRVIRFIHYNDLHANLSEHLDLQRQDDGSTKLVRRGGIARLATKIRQLRQERPDNITMNIGDTYHGGVEALYTDGNAIVDAVNAIGFDIGVPGNWDWAYGPDVTRMRFKGDVGSGCPQVTAIGVMYGFPTIKTPNFPHLGGNVVYTKPASLAGQPFLPPTAIIERNGIKIGLIGMTSDIVPRMHETMAACLDFMQGEAAYRDYVQAHARDLRAKGAQVVVVMSELGIHKDWKLANVIEHGLVDVFFSAHTHEVTFEPLTSESGALVVEAGNDAYVGSMDIEFDGSGKIAARHWQLHVIDADIPEDSAVKELVANARAPFLQQNPNLKLRKQFGGHVLTQPITTVIGRSSELLSRRNALDNAFNRAFTEAQRRAFGTDIALSPGFRFDAVVASQGSVVENDAVATGEITVEDAYRFFPAPSTLGVGDITGADLKTLIEGNLTAVFSRNAFAQSGGWTDGFAGIRVTVDLAATDGSRIRDLRHADGSAINDQSVLKAAGCRRPMDDSSTLCSYPLFSGVVDAAAPGSTQNWYITDFMQYAFANGLWPASTASVFTDVSGTMQWPQSSFYQPLEGAR